MEKHIDRKNIDAMLQNPDSLDTEDELIAKDSPLVLEKLLPGFKFVGGPILKPNGIGSVRIYSGIRNLGDSASCYEPKGWFAIVIDTTAKHYAPFASDHGAVCVSHDMREIEGLSLFVSLVVDGICEIEAREGIGSSS